MDYPINAEAARQLIEMVDRDVVRAELARAMGWQVFPYAMPSQDGQWKTLLCPPGERVHISTVVEPPDPFINAADNRALVEWLVGYGHLSPRDYWARFLFQLCLVVSVPAIQFSVNNPDEYAKRLMTAPLETITLAAAKALGIQEAGE